MHSSVGKTLAAISNLAGFAFFDPNTGKQLRKVKDSYGRKEGGFGMTHIAYTSHRRFPFPSFAAWGMPVTLPPSR
jgi:hypothetical protein